MPSFSQTDAKRNILDHPAARIDCVFERLGGTIRRNRGQAVWRESTDWNVSFNVAQGLWFDHVAGVGGGVLALIAQIRGGGHADAVNWLRDEGMPDQVATLRVAERLTSRPAGE